MTSSYLAAGDATNRVLIFRSALLIIAFSFFWWVLTVATHIDAPSAALQLDRLTRLDSAALVPPPSPSSLVPRTLPDDWLTSGPGLSSAWYSAVFSLPQAPVQLWAIYLPHVTMNVAVHLNGELIGREGRMTSPISRHWSQPLFFYLPVGLLRAGSNELHLRIVTEPPGTGFLGKVYLGPAESLVVSYDRAYRIRIVAVQMSIVGTLTMAFLMFVLWFMRRQDSVYLWFGIGLICWSVHNFNITVTEPPLPLAFWVRLMTATIIWVAICMAFFALRFLNQRRPYSERILLGTGILSCALMPFLPAWFFHPQQVAYFELIPTATGMYAISVMLMALLRRPVLDLETAIVSMLGISMISTGGYDCLVIANVIERSTPRMLPYTGPFVTVGFGFVLLHRFASALHVAENLNVTLEQRVAEKSLELEREHERVRHYERQQAVSAERQRIVRDMHDGVGGQLVSTLSAIENGRAELPRVAEALREALSDLRLTIDSLDPEINSLAQLLGLLRARVEPRLHSCGIELDWQVRPLPQWMQLGPHNSLQVLRIVQEAITNTIKHANASKITVRTGLVNESSEPSVFVEIADNGQGFKTARVGGRGLQNMQIRAAKIAARFDIQTDQAGTRIQLLFAQPSA